MSSWKKVVDGGTKTKNAPPKAKYIDPIIQATFSHDGSLQDISRALSARLRDSNSIVVFKSLLIIHTMLRVGSLENVYGYLSSDPNILRLKEVISGFDTPNTLNLYAGYLYVRLKTYAALGHDVIRDKSDRIAPSRLRKLTVDKGLLREVGMVERLMNALVKCKFYLDNIEDELTMSALRLLVKDLLVLFQVLNEGVINVLEHYFEMTHVDASTALKIYKNFCSDTEMVVAYLGIAKKLQNVINVDIPNLRHAPVSLAKSLEEYLNDPNFEQNRLEYKDANQAADTPSRGSKAQAPPPKAESKATETGTAGTSSSTPSQPQMQSQPSKPSAFLDFFSSIEQEQQSMFNPATSSPTASWFQQNAVMNPFGQAVQVAPSPFQQLIVQPTGVSPSPFGQPTIIAQPTGSPFQNMLQPQITGVVNPFHQTQMRPISMAVTGNPFTATQPIQPQPTGAFASIFTATPSPQPQTTAASLFMSAATPSPLPVTMGAFGTQAQPSTDFSSVFGMQSQAQPQTSPFGQNTSSSSPFSQPQHQGSMNAFSQPSQEGIFSQQPPNPFPLSSSQVSSPFSQPSPADVASGMQGSAFTQAFGQSSTSTFSSTPQPSSTGTGTPSNPFGTSSAPKPLVAQKTGTRNPFALPSDFETKEPLPPMPPSLNQLARGASPFSPQSQPTGHQPSVGNSMMGSIASEFALMRTESPSNLNGTSNVHTPSQPQSTAPLKPHMTGGVKPFVPTSSFGAELFKSSGMDSGSFSSPTSSFGSMPPLPTGTSTGPSSTFSDMPTGTSTTSTFSSSVFSSLPPSTASTAPAPLQPTKTGFGGSTVKPFQPSSSFGTSLMSSVPSGGAAGSDSSFSLPTTNAALGSPFGVPNGSMSVFNNNTTPLSTSTPFNQTSTSLI